jgi:uncharacterized protein (TIGR00369 family)
MTVLDSPSVDRSRTVTWSDPAVAAARGKDHAGLDLLQGLFAGGGDPPPFLLLLGISGVSAEAGTVVMQVDPAEFHYNPLGSVHGGLLASLLDSVMGCAVHTMLPAGAGYATIEMKVSLLRPVTVATGTLTATGITLGVGRTVAFAEGRVEDGRGRLIAHATTSCAVFAPERPSDPVSA